MLQVKGLNFVAFNLRQLQGPALQSAANAAVQALGEVAKDALVINSTRRDHTLRQLAALDHPYASRHGTITIHRDKPYVVHTHSGRMAASIDGKLIAAPGASGAANVKYKLGFTKGAPHYAKYVVQGTKVMHGRDVVRSTVLEKPVRKAMMQAVVRTFGAKLRTQAGLRFGSSV